MYSYNKMIDSDIWRQILNAPNLALSVFKQEKNKKWILTLNSKFLPQYLFIYHL